VKLCFECGAKLPVGTPGNRCPGCVLRLGLEAAWANDLPTAGLDVADPQAISLGRVTHFGDYELLEEIARGGMGIVYKARQVSLNRLVAVKMILFGELAGRSVIERFQREAAAAAQLQHPRIVAVHEVGEHEGQHYFSMDYVAGPNLAKMVGSRPMPVRRAARYVELIAEAIAYAHGQGVLHRDLKPSNVLIDPTDQPRVTDFGLAKSLAGDSELTVSGQVLGTPNYLPPEQAAGRRGTAGPASDVYGLGAILYFLITARPPFVGESLETTLGQVLHQEPVSPRLLNGSVPRDLATICLKCLEKEPPRRYPTAQALADELGRFLRGEPIQARPIGAAGKAWRWCLRKPVVAGLTGALGLALVLGFAGVTWQWRQAEHERQLQRRVAYAASVRVAQAALADHDRGTAATLLRGQRPQAGEEDLRGIEWRYLWQESPSGELRSFHHPQMVRDAVLSPTGQYLATSSLDNIVRIWNPDSGELLHEFESLYWLAPAGSLGFSPAGDWLVTYGAKGGLAVRETRTWQVIKQMARAAPPLALSADGTVVVAGCDEGGLVVWDLANGSQRHLNTAGDWVRYHNLATAPDGVVVAYSTHNCFMSVHPDGDILLCDLRSGQTDILTTNASTFSLRFSPDGKWLAAPGFITGEISIWDTAIRAQVIRFAAHEGPVLAAGFSPDSRTMASGGYDQRIHLWETGTWKRKATLSGHEGSVFTCAFSADGQRLVSAAGDCTAKLWDVGGLPASSLTFALPADATPVGILPDGKTLVAVSEPGVGTNAPGPTAHLFDLPSGRLIQSNGWDHVLQQGCSHLKFFARNQVVVGVDTNGTVQLWDLVTGNHIRSVKLGGTGFDPMYLSPDNRWLLRGGRRVSLWDLSTGRTIFDSSHPPRAAFFAAAFSPNNRLLAFTGADFDLRIWDLVGHQEKMALKANGHGPLIRSLRFSPDSKLLASGGWDGLWLWSVETGKALHGPIRREGVNHVSFSADSRTLIAITDDGPGETFIRFWNVTTGQEVLFLPNAGMGSGLLGSVSAEYTAGQADLNPAGDLFIRQDLSQHELNGPIVVTRLPSLAEIDSIYSIRLVEQQLAERQLAAFARRRAETDNQRKESR
jgi:eukaryotic-like serine/threonine-protein kinase